MSPQDLKMQFDFGQEKIENTLEIIFSMHNLRNYYFGHNIKFILNVNIFINTVYILHIPSAYGVRKILRWQTDVEPHRASDIESGPGGRTNLFASAVFLVDTEL